MWYVIIIIAVLVIFFVSRNQGKKDVVETNKEVSVAKEVVTPKESPVPLKPIETTVIPVSDINPDGGLEKLTELVKRELSSIDNKFNGISKTSMLDSVKKSGNIYELNNFTIPVELVLDNNTVNVMVKDDSGDFQVGFVPTEKVAEVKRYLNQDNLSTHGVVTGGKYYNTSTNGNLLLNITNYGLELVLKEEK